MKNKLSYALLILFTSFCFCGCKNSKIQMSESPYAEYNANYLSASAIEDSITPESISIQISNTSNHVAYLGEAYSLEIYKEGKWYLLPMTPQDIVSIAYIIESGESFSKDYNWHSLYGTLSPGQYRIVIDINLQHESNHVPSYVIATFSIE